MRRSLFLLAALLSWPVFAQDMVFRQGADSVRLTQKECTVPTAIAAVAPQYRDAQRQGVLTVQGQTYRLCWLLVDGVIYTMDEDGDQARFQVTNFKPDGL